MTDVPTYKISFIQVIKCYNVSQLPAPHSVRWAISGATTGLALVFIAAYITGQFSTETTDIKVTEESDEPKQPRNNYIFTTIEGKTVVLSEFEVFDIIQMSENGVFLKEIADKYDMRPINVSRIINQVSSFIVKK